MYLLPAEAILLLAACYLLLVPFLTWARDGWGAVRVIAVGAVVSWLSVNLSLWSAPPDNGLASLVNLALGWIYLPTVLAPPVGAERLLSRWLRREVLYCIPCALRRTGVRVVFAGALLCLGYGLFGKVSEQRAGELAEVELRKHGYEPLGNPVFRGGATGWVVEYPESEFGEIALDRNGRMRWIGQP